MSKQVVVVVALLALVSLSRGAEEVAVAAVNSSSTTISSEPVVLNGTSNITIVNNVARSMNVAPQPAASSHNTASASAAASGGSSVLIICISLAVVVCVVGLIAGALFVMRKHFNLWKLGGGIGGGNADEKAEEGSNEPVTSSSNDQLTKSPVAVQQVNENNVTENLTSVENKTAIEQIVKSETAVVEGEVNAETPLLAAEAPAVVASEQAVVAAPVETVINEQVSSSSLIANVLNDLSESVVAKLSKSPGKSSKSNLADAPAATVESQDSEKQPLNQ